MTGVFEFEAVAKAEAGDKAAKAARRQGNVPAIIYGAGKAPKMFVMDHNKVIKHLEHEAVYSHILDIKIDGKSEKAILKDIQRHPSKAQILHMDFQRVSKKEKLRVNVPLHFMGEETSVGAKKGGIVTHSMVDVEVSCLPADLPEYIEVDLTDLDIGESLHLTDIGLPKGVEIIALMHGADHDLPIVSVTSKGGASEDEDEGVAEEGEASEEEASEE